MGLLSAMKGDRKKEGEDEARLSQTYKDMQALGMDELGRYKDTKLRPEQEKKLEGYEEEQLATSGEFFDEAGLAGGAQEVASMRQWSDDVKMLKYNMEQTTKQESWAHALQALGLGQDASRQIAMMHTKDREEKIQIFSSLMGAIGGLMGKKSGGK